MYIKNSKTLIKEPLEIYNLLKNIQKSKQLISLSFKSQPQYCLTTLLEVHHDTKVLIFDEPNPKLTSQLMKDEEAQFSLKLEKLPVNFKSKFIVGSNNINEGNLYTPYPEEIDYPQNRQFHRFQTKYIKNIETTIYATSTKQIDCQLIDISLNGLCLQLPYSYASLFQKTQLINDIYVQLPNQKGFSISAKIKNTRIQNNYHNIALGLEIRQQKPSIEKSIQQFIFRTENI